MSRTIPYSKYAFKWLSLGRSYTDLTPQVRFECYGPGRIVLLLDRLPARCRGRFQKVISNACSLLHHGALFFSGDTRLRNLGFILCGVADRFGRLAGSGWNHQTASERVIEGFGFAAKAGLLPRVLNQSAAQSLGGFCELQQLPADLGFELLLSIIGREGMGKEGALDREDGPIKGANILSYRLQVAEQEQEQTEGKTFTGECRSQVVSHGFKFCWRESGLSSFARVWFGGTFRHRETPSISVGVDRGGW